MVVIVVDSVLWARCEGFGRWSLACSGCCQGHHKMLGCSSGIRFLNMVLVVNMLCS